MKILCFPLSNVLGHLTRTLALAEEFDAQGHQVYIASDGTYSCLEKALAPSIRILSSPEISQAAIQSFGLIKDYEETSAGDRANLECCQPIDEPELARRRERMMLMVERDSAIVEDVRPDAIITDYRFTTQLVEHSRPQRVFHISHILGYPSLYRRVMGHDFVPLHSGHILVPGITGIEYWNCSPPPSTLRRREIMCGHFRWTGWRRLHPNVPAPPESDVFLCFGSTGNGGKIVPWFLRNIPQRYRISAICPGLSESEVRANTHIAQRGDLEEFLNTTGVVFCHGGHGTVMECIRHRIPMAIFPHNIEQLEIGRRIEKMGLGLVVKRPYEQVGVDELGGIIEQLRTNVHIRHNLETYSKLLCQYDGPKLAVSTVLQCIADKNMPGS